MKLFKAFLVAAFAFLLALPCSAQLTAENGKAAGKSLLLMYARYRTMGNKIDLTNPNNIENIVTLLDNIQGVSATTAPKDFLTGLMSGSKNLINKTNTGDVIKCLSSISGLDISAGDGQEAVVMLKKLFSYIK